MSSQDFSDKRVAILAPESTSGEAGGAERFYQGLLLAIKKRVGHAELISLPTDESTFECIRSNYDQWSALDLSSFDMVVSTKAPTYAVNHPRHVLYLVHTIRVFYDMFDEVFPDANDTLLEQRKTIHSIDTVAIGKIKKCYAIGYEVANRLKKWNSVDAEVMHPPLGIDVFKQGRSEDYFFMPGRLHSWKRVDLAIRAVRLSKCPLKLVIAGTGEAEAELKALAADDPRIVFLGKVSDDELIELYSKALAVIFVPLREDYGYVTLEAFKSGKPVITCTDSGEPLQFIKNGESGFICDPDPKSISSTMEQAISAKEKMIEMGRNGMKSTAHITWKNIANTLLKAGFADSNMGQSTGSVNVKTKVAILDMQPIDPPVGGGRLRLLGLYHGLGENIDAKYIGTYDWPGERYRQHKLTPTLEEIDIPLSDAHHIAANQLAQEAGGKVVIDLAFSRLCHLSPEYLTKAVEAVDWADVVVFSHPWVFPLIEKHLKSTQMIVYDSQNVEGFLRAQLLNKNNLVERELLREVVQAEYHVGQRAQLIFACSQEDIDLFSRIYEWSANKMKVVPNGVMVSKITTPTKEEKTAAKQSVGLLLNRIAAIFIGSNYQPNIEAATFIVKELASSFPEIDFVIAGGVGACITGDLPENVVITGFVDDEQKLTWLQAVDFAVNPMFSGSGTNIKMFDFMAAGLPVVTTRTGARGIDVSGRDAMLITAADTESFIKTIRRVCEPVLRTHIGDEARLCVEEGYAWEQISRYAGNMIVSKLQYIGKPSPMFSVVIPTYERHDKLDSLVSHLQQQVERDFEVIIIDQSATKWRSSEKGFGFPMIYIHTPVKGAVRARNTGASLANGEVIAFTDDDCQPDSMWLQNARQYLDDSNVVGIEGIIISDHLYDTEWRPVTNVGFEGIGFMTANLMVRTECFSRLGGFDLDFDKPHFREDTEFGWRLQGLGEVPYADDVTVFHPAQLRVIERESSAERARFFIKDALLYKKSPSRYKELFFQECHYKNTPGFIENLQRGFDAYNVDPPGWIMSYLNNDV